MSSLVILVLSLMNCSRSSISLSGWSSWRSLRILLVPGLPPEHLVNILHRLDPVLKDARLRFSCLNLSENSKSFTRMLWSSRAAKRRAVLPPQIPCQLALRSRSMFPGWTQLLHNDKLLVLHSPGDGGAEVTFLTSGLSGEAQ